MAKASNLLYGLIIVGLVTAIIGIFMATLSVNYDKTYDSSELEVYNQLTEITNLTEDIKDKSADIKEKPNVLDVIGGFFSDAYSAAKLTLASIDTVDTMSNQAIDQANLGESGQYFRVALSAMIIIFIVLGVLISAVIKKDM